MAYHITGYQTNPITKETIFSILCDTVADLPSYAVYDNGYGGEIGQGSKAFVIADGSSYLADSNRQWIYQPNPNAWVNVYTKNEVDTLISGYQPLLTFGTHTVKDSTESLNSGAIWFSIFEQILGLNNCENLAAGDDLDNFMTPGIYRCTNSATAGQITHMPSPMAQQAGGRLIVFSVGGSGRYIQFYISAGARFWMRSNTSQGWLPWYEYAGIQVVQDSTQSITDVSI